MELVRRTGLLVGVLAVIGIPHFSGLCEGAVVVSFKLKHFQNPGNKRSDGQCCDTLCRPCDYEFNVCFSPMYSFLCEYGRITTGELDVYAESFHFPTRFRNRQRNPMLISVPEWRRNVRVSVQVIDIDMWLYDDNDLISQYNFFIFEDSPALTEDQASWRSWHISKGDMRLSFEYKVYCEKNYYGYRCSTHCLPRDDRDGHYTCHPTSGRKICNQGYFGENCNQKIVSTTPTTTTRPEPSTQPSTRRVPTTLSPSITSTTSTTPTITTKASSTTTTTSTTQTTVPTTNATVTTPAAGTTTSITTGQDTMLPTTVPQTTAPQETGSRSVEVATKMRTQTTTTRVPQKGNRPMAPVPGMITERYRAPSTIFPTTLHGTTATPSSHPTTTVQSHLTNASTVATTATTDSTTILKETTATLTSHTTTIQSHLTNASNVATTATTDGTTNLQDSTATVSKTTTVAQTQAPQETSSRSTTQQSTATTSGRLTTTMPAHVTNASTVATTATTVRTKTKAVIQTTATRVAQKGNRPIAPVPESYRVLSTTSHETTATASSHPTTTVRSYLTNASTVATTATTDSTTNLKETPLTTSSRLTTTIQSHLKNAATVATTATTDSDTNLQDTTATVSKPATVAQTIAPQETSSRSSIQQTTAMTSGRLTTTVPSHVTNASTVATTATTVSTANLQETTATASSRLSSTVQPHLTNASTVATTVTTSDANIMTSDVTSSTRIYDIQRELNAYPIKTSLTCWNSPTTNGIGSNVKLHQCDCERRPPELPTFDLAWLPTEFIPKVDIVS